MGNSGQGHDCAPSAPKPRQLLALLALNANQFVPTTTCIDELWGADPPRSAVTTLRTYIMRIRRALQAAGTGERPPHGILRTRQHGYQLLLGRTGLDLFQFTDQVDEGKRALLSGDHRRGAETLRDALTLWKGSPVVDVQAGPFITAHQARLQEQRLSCVELHIEAELQLGLHHELISELTGLTADFPTHENLHAQLMLALFRSGRQAQALTVYRQLCAVLAEELGIEPSRRLRQLHTAILLADPALDPPDRSSDGLPQTLDLVVLR
ncbi:AfsR/SARP family transcriptional regulator [Streptomyces sp. NPDC003015]